MRIVHVLFLSAIIVSFSSISYGQFDLLNKVKEKVEEKVEQKTDEAIDKAIDTTLNGAQQDKKNNESQPAATKQETQVPQTPVPEEGLKAYSKFDFVPGDQVIFFDDFAQENVGDFPGKWNTNGSGETVTFNKYPGKWFNMKMNGAFYPELKNPFPDNYTIEFDMIYQVAPTRSTGSAMELDLYSSINGQRIDDLIPGNGGFTVQATNYTCSTFNWKEGQYGDINNRVDLATLADNNDKPVRISICFG